MRKRNYNKQSYKKKPEKKPKKSSKLKKPKYKINAGTLKKLKKLLTPLIKTLNKPKSTKSTKFTKSRSLNSYEFNSSYDLNDYNKRGAILKLEDFSDSSKFKHNDITKIKKLIEKSKNEGLGTISITDVLPIYKLANLNEYNDNNIPKGEIKFVMEFAEVKKGIAIKALKENKNPENAVIKLITKDWEQEDKEKIKEVITLTGVSKFEAAYLLKHYNRNIITTITAILNDKMLTETI